MLVFPSEKEDEARKLEPRVHVLEAGSSPCSCKLEVGGEDLNRVRAICKLRNQLAENTSSTDFLNAANLRLL